MGGLIIDPLWLRNIPGHTISAVELLMLVGEVEPPSRPLQQAQEWFGGQPVVASMLGRNGHSCAVTDFRLRPDGFERIVVVAPSATTETRAGRIAARLLELEAYRMMALLGWPVAKSLREMLSGAEQSLAMITQEMQASSRSDQELLDELKALAAQVEHAIAQYGYRFAASAAYQRIVASRLAELRETPISGTQTIGEFLQRRFAPPWLPWSTPLGAWRLYRSGSSAPVVFCVPASILRWSSRASSFWPDSRGARSCSFSSSAPWKGCLSRPSRTMSWAFCTTWPRRLKKGDCRCSLNC